MESHALVVGSGSIAIKHFNNLKKLLPNSILKVYATYATENISPKNLISTISEALHYRPFLVIIANPSSLHIQTAKLFAGIGANLLIEKPISNSTANVEDLLNICRQNRVLLTVGYNLRFLDSLNFFRTQVDSKVVGTPLLVKCEVGQFLPTWRSQVDYRRAVSAKRDLGGGALLELSHEFDYLLWIFGKIDWVRATVMKQSNLEIDVEDSAFLTLGINNPNNANLVANLSLDFIRHDKQRNCTLIGETGSLRWDGIRGQVSIMKAGSNHWKTIFSSKNKTSDTYFDELKNFIECIDLQKTPRVTGVDGLNVVKVIESALVSAPTGEQINVK
jgi:predicted dehydrogenase